MDIQYELDEERTTTEVKIQLPMAGTYRSDPPKVTIDFQVYDTLEGYLSGRIYAHYPGDDPGASWNRRSFNADMECTLDEMKDLHRKLGKAIREAEKKVGAGDWCWMVQSL